MVVRLGACVERRPWECQISIELKDEEVHRGRKVTPLDIVATAVPLRAVWTLHCCVTLRDDSKLHDCRIDSFDIFNSHCCVKL